MEESVKKDLEDLLNSLGSRTKSILAKLKEENIKGQRNDTCFCPIRNWIKAKNKFFLDIHVEEQYTYALYKDDTGKRIQFRVDTPSIIFTFICRFDKKEFKELYVD